VLPVFLHVFFRRFHAAAQEPNHGRLNPAGISFILRRNEEGGKWSVA
jgi:hypothetical protein